MKKIARCRPAAAGKNLLILMVTPQQMLAAAAQYEKENNDVEAKPKVTATEVSSSDVSGSSSILGSLEKMVESR